MDTMAVVCSNYDKYLQRIVIPIVRAGRKKITVAIEMKNRKERNAFNNSSCVIEDVINCSVDIFSCKFSCNFLIDLYSYDCLMCKCFLFYC